MKDKLSGWMWRGGIAGGVVAAIAVGVGLQSKLQGQGTQPPLARPLFERGMNLFSQQCAACHGATGRGDGLAAYLLQPKPRDFTKGTFRIVSTQEAKPTDQDLFNTISHGMLGSAMPPWEHFKEEDRWALVYAVRYFAGLPKAMDAGDILVDQAQTPKWETAKKIVVAEQATGPVIEIPAEPTSTAEELEKGKAIYLSACASCHGADGKGQVPQRFKDEAGYPLEARDFTIGIFKGGSSSADLYRRLIAGIPGSPMPSYRDAFSDEQIWQLIHYVQTLVPKWAQESNTQKVSLIRVKKMDGSVPLQPGQAAWDAAPPVRLALMPLWWHSLRVTHVEVRALHDGKKISVKLSWEDATKNESNIRVNEFTDEAAVQFSEQEEPPFFAMGEKATPVNIWLWKAATQKDVGRFQDVKDAYPNAYQTPTFWPFKNGGKTEEEEPRLMPEEKNFRTGEAVGNLLAQRDRNSAIENLIAKGFSTLTLRRMISQNVKGFGEWNQGRWEVVFCRDLDTGDMEDVKLVPGKTVNAAFAVWNGESKQRNGQKSVTIWHRLKLE